jgi:hypothetical protein
MPAKRNRKPQTKPTECALRAKIAAQAGEIKALKVQLRHAADEARAAGITQGLRTVLNRLYANANAGEAILIGQLLLNGRPREPLDPREAELRERVLARNTAILVEVGFSPQSLAMKAEKV